MHGSRYQALVMLACVLAACSSVPSNSHMSTGPYWDNQDWLTTLVNSVQSALHAPGEPVDTSTPDYQATIRFHFQDGIIEYPEIVTGTGNPALDKLMIDQVASV